MVLAQNFDTLITQCGFGPVDALPFGISIAFFVLVNTASATITSVTQAFTTHIMLLIGRFRSASHIHIIVSFADELREFAKMLCDEHHTAIEAASLARHANAGSI